MLMIGRISLVSIRSYRNDDSGLIQALGLNLVGTYLHNSLSNDVSPVRVPKRADIMSLTLGIMVDYLDLLVYKLSPFFRG